MYTAHENNMGFKVISDDPEGMTYEGMMLTCDRLVIAPIIAGSGGGTGRILLGAALIGLDVYSRYWRFLYRGCR